MLLVDEGSPEAQPEILDLCVVEVVDGRLVGDARESGHSVHRRPGRWMFGREPALEILNLFDVCHEKTPPITK